MERLFQTYPAVRRVVKSSGIVSDILQITSKYRLCKYIDEFLNGVPFPCKKNWSGIVYKAVDEMVMEQRAHDFVTLSLSRAYRVACCNHDFHPLWIAEHNTKGHTRHFQDMVKLNCVVEGRLIVLIVVETFLINLTILYIHVTNTLAPGNCIGQSV